MWGLKMQVFDSQKVLAVGQTSGSGGWVKKLALITMKGHGLSIAFGNPKKAMSNSSCLIRGGKSESGSWHGVPAQKKRFVLPLGNVWLTSIRISGQFLYFRKTKFLYRGKVFAFEIPNSHFLFT